MGICGTFAHNFDEQELRYQCHGDPATVMEYLIRGLSFQQSATISCSRKEVKTNSSSTHCCAMKILYVLSEYSVKN